MARKNGLNRKEQLLCAKWLTEGIKADLVAKKLGTEVHIVNKFTQEKLDEADDKARKRAADQNRVAQGRRAKAQILTEAINVANEEDFQ